MKIALLSNVTTGVLAGYLPKDISVWSPPGFGAWIETALEPPREMIEFGPEAIYILLDHHFETEQSAARSGNAPYREALETSFPGVSVIEPDVAAIAAEFGEGFYDEKMWKLGASPWSLAGIKEL